MARWILALVLVSVSAVSGLAEIPFKHMVVDAAGPKDPWAKILADINDDGRLDVVLSPSELKGSFYKISWFRAPPDPKAGNWLEHVIVGRIECVIHGLVTADMNGDGMVDVVASEMHQGIDPDEVAVFVSQQKGTSWTKRVISTQGSHYIQVADIDADGDIDLLGANWSGPYQPIELWLNQGQR